MIVSSLEVLPGQRVVKHLGLAQRSTVRAKHAGKGRHAVFDTAMHLESLDRLRMEQDLRSAIEEEQFRVVYQPLINMVRFLAKVRASSLIRSAGTSEMAAAHSAVFGVLSFSPMR